MWSGTLQGEIYMFRGNRLFAVKKAHSGHITALATGPEYMVSGGKDGNVHFWTVRVRCGALCRRVSATLEADVAWATGHG